MAVVTPAHVPGLAELQGRRLAAVHQAHRLLQYAAVAPAAMPPEDAVRTARKLLLQHLVAPPAQRSWVVQVHDDLGVEWLELPGVGAVRWDP